MGEIISNFFLNIVGEELCVFFCSMLPVVELRGAIPLAWGFGLPWYQSFLISVLGNILPIPFILLFINTLIKWMSASKVKILNKFANFLLSKVEKNRDKIEKYAFGGLCIFVAIPLPGTGAWTGSIVAAAIGMKPLKAFVSTVLGVIIAGIIVTFVMYGGIGFLAWIL